MMALNLSELKVSKNTKAHIWNRHKLHKKQVMEALNQGILDVFEVEDENIYDNPLIDRYSIVLLNDQVVYNIRDQNHPKDRMYLTVNANNNYALNLLRYPSFDVILIKDYQRVCN